MKHLVQVVHTVILHLMATWLLGFGFYNKDVTNGLFLRAEASMIDFDEHQTKFK